MYMVTSDEPVKMVCSIHNVKSVKVSLRKNDDVLRRISVMSIFQKKLPHYLVTVLENLFDKYLRLIPRQIQTLATWLQRWWIS